MSQMISQLDTNVKLGSHYVWNNVQMAIQSKEDRVFEAVSLAKKNLNIRSDSALSRHYKLSRTAVNQWKLKGQVNTKNIRKLSEDSGLTESWIEEGEEPKYLSDLDVGSTKDSLAIINAAKQLHPTHSIQDKFDMLSDAEKFYISGLIDILSSSGSKNVKK